VGNPKKKKLPVVENLLVTTLAAEGKAIARTDSGVVFITGAVPGDLVDVQLTKKKSNFAEGFPVKFHKLSDDRVEPKCQHFGVCGGCKWQQLPYNLQLNAKQQQVIDAMERIGKLNFASHEPITPSPNEYFYRNKLEYTFSDFRWLTKDEMDVPGERDLNALGFHIPGMFDRIVDIQKCWLQPEPTNAVRLAVKHYATEYKLELFDLKRQNGFLRNLIIRNTVLGELMVIVVFYQNLEAEIQGVMQMLADSFPEITSLLYIVNSKRNDTITDQEVICFKGTAFIMEKMDDLYFKVGPKSFYQTNPDQAYNLYKKTLEYANLQGNELVYDLYTGTGTIANFVAKKARKVIGIEYVPEAIEDAKENARINNLDNTEFFAGDIKDLLTGAFIEEKGYPDVIIIDPPRAGMHPDVVNAVLYASPDRIVYVSCNPGTQARDLALLAVDYEPIIYAPVDMFPHTFHIENVALLKKRKK